VDRKAMMARFLIGKKTYIVAGLMFLLAIAKMAHIVEPSTYDALMGLLAALGFGALRAGIETVAKECTE
jgi:hypothetical protein